MKLFRIPSRSLGMIDAGAPVFFRTIAVAVPRKEIYARLGFRAGHTLIQPEHREMVESYIDEARGFVELKGSAILLNVARIEEDSIVLSGGDMFVSSQLARMASGCSSLLLMGATAGSRIMEEIRRDTSIGHITRGVVLDAAASEMTDGALDWIMGYVNQDLRRRAKRLTRRRYSAGYGDFALENQRVIYELLRLGEIGVSITGEYLLIPEKSVTAIAGVRTSVA